MKDVPRITKEPEERRQEILDTSMRLFYEKGYEKTSITDIAKAMHVAQGLCYRYFASKEEIFDTALEQYAESLAAQMTKGMKDKEVPLAQLIREMPTFLETERDDNFYYKVCHGQENWKIHQQMSMKVCEKMLPAVKEVLDRAVKKGEIVCKDTQTAASFCVYGQLGILLDRNTEPEQRVQKIKTFLIEMLGVSDNKK